jgi:hypothetical protein
MTKMKSELSNLKGQCEKQSSVLLETGPLTHFSWSLQPKMNSSFRW